LKEISANSSPISWRQIHRWCGLFLASFTIFYCLTGLLLNHRKDFDYFISREKSTVNIASLETSSLHSLLQECRTIIGRSDDPRVIRIPDKDTIEFLYGSHGKTTYKIRPDAAIMEIIEKKPFEPFNWLNSLHKISGEKSVFWLICADLVCLLILLMTISGLTVMRYKRQDYLLLIAGVVALFLGMALA
jgi:hypothetical protein